MIKPDLSTERPGGGQAQPGLPEQGRLAVGVERGDHSRR